MRIHKGTDRIAFLGERYTLKAAISEPVPFFQGACSIKKSDGLYRVIDNWKQIGVEGQGGLKWLLLHGLDANRREARLARYDNIVTPTSSVLGGMVNIQPTTEDIAVSFEDVIGAFADNMRNPGRDIPRIGHMLEDVGNFGFYHGRVLFRDGGSIGLERTLVDESQRDCVERALGDIATKI